MMAASPTRIAQQLAQKRTVRREPTHRRTLAPVRRGSRYAGGRWEDEWRNRQTRAEMRRLMFAARRFDHQGKLPGERNGPLGYIGVEILELLTNLALKRNGRVDLAGRAIAKMVRHAYSAVRRALARLKAEGFLDWARRIVQVDGDGPRGPQVKQETNLYRVSLPERAAKLLGAYGKPPPPDDDEHRRRRAREAFDALLALEDETGLRAQLASWGAAIEAAARRSDANPPPGQNPGSMKIK